ncbi:Spc7 kinetochore protein-domain-containing protein [Gaertneriomyces semiglobifer]|nr:Spc7 kinetochore protein-domain-containing protein [Gaertneriomyces semiglobifer]
MRGRDSIVGFFDVTTNSFIYSGDSSSEDDFLNEHLRSPHVHPTQSYESDDDDPETMEPEWQGNSEVAPLTEGDMELQKHQDSEDEGGASLPDISMIDDFEEHSHDEDDPEDSAADMEMTQCVGSLDSIPNASLKDNPVIVDMKGFEARISPIYPQRYNEYGATPLREDHSKLKPNVGQPVREDGVEPDRKRPRMSLAASDDTLGRFFFPTGSEELGIPDMTQDITRFAGRILPDTDDTISSEGSAACAATPTQPKQRFSVKSEHYGSIPRRRPTPGPKTPAAVMPSISIELTPLATSSAIPESKVEAVEQFERLPNPESYKPGCQAQDAESPLTVKPPKNLVSAGRSAEVSFADTDGGGDLMNEELSLVDGSFLEESQPQTIKTVQDFLQATGIYFQDALTTSFRRETNAYLRTTEPPTEIDYCKAAMMWNSELAAYEMGCRLLYSEIEGIRESLKNIVDEAEESTPLIFYDVSECSPPEHGEITRQLKGTRSFTRAEAKEAWHTWRFSLMDDLAKDFAISMKNLTKDQRALQKLAVRYADAIAFSQKVEAACLEELEARKDELERQRIADEEEAAQLEQLQRDQDQKIADLRKEVANLKEACQVVEERESLRLPERELIKDKIAEAEKICEQLMVFDPEELGALRDEYELLVSLFPLSAVHYSPTECTFSYDQAINITLTKCEGDRYAVELSISTPKVLMRGKTMSILWNY